MREVGEGPSVGGMSRVRGVGGMGKVSGLRGLGG